MTKRSSDAAPDDAMTARVFCRRLMPAPESAAEAVSAGGRQKNAQGGGGVRGLRLLQSQHNVTECVGTSTLFSQNTQVLSAIRIKRQDGFTVLELLVTVTLISLLVSIWYVPRIQSELDEHHRTVARITAEEIFNIGTAAQHFAMDGGGIWPGVADDCTNAVHLLTGSGYLAGIDVYSAFYTGEGEGGLPFAVGPGETAEYGRYYTQCPEVPAGSGRRRHLVIRYALAGARSQYVGMIQSNLPAAVRLSGDAALAVEANVPLPAAVPVVNSMMPLSGERAMTGDLLLGGNQIAGVQDVFLDSGQTLGSAMLFTGIVKPGARVLKPSCPGGYSPSIHVTPVDVSHSSGLPVSKFRVWAVNDNRPTSAAPSWLIRSSVWTSAGEERDHSSVSMSVAVRCQL